MTLPRPWVSRTSSSPTSRPAATMSLDTWVTAKLGSDVVVSNVTTLIPREAACSSGASSASASVAATAIASRVLGDCRVDDRDLRGRLVLGRRLLLDRDLEGLGLRLRAEPDRVEEVVSGHAGDEDHLVVGASARGAASLRVRVVAAGHHGQRRQCGDSDHRQTSHPISPLHPWAIQSYSAARGPTRPRPVSRDRHH